MNFESMAFSNEKYLKMNYQMSIIKAHVIGEALYVSRWGHGRGLAVGRICLEAGHYCLSTYVTCNRYLLGINRYHLIFPCLEPGPRSG